MIDNYREARAVAGMASELLLDLGDFITGGRRPPRWLRLLAWIVTLAGVGGLWRWFHWLFDTYPGWAVLAAGLWGMCFVGTLGLWSAGIKYGSSSVANQDRDPPSNEH